MAHYLPPHGDPNLAHHQTMQAALQMDPNHPPPPPPQGPMPPPQPVTARKRKKTDADGGEAPQPAEPRRLRRSHEACARCRSKKIKCDSKHPRCTACASAGVQCHQEDRHRQTLVARGHTEHVERQLLICAAILKRQNPDFDLSNVEDMAVRQGIEIDAIDPSSFGFFSQTGMAGPSNRGYPLRSEGPPGEGSPPRPYGYGLPQPMMHPPPGYPPMGVPYYGPPPPHMAPPPGFNPHMHPPPPPPHYQHPPQPQPQPQAQPQPQPQPPMAPPPTQAPPRPLSAQEVRGQEPLPNDLSTSQALAKAFGVSPAIVGDLKLGPHPIDTEDLAVGSNGLTSRRDIGDPNMPRDATKWIVVDIPSARPNSASSPTAPSVDSPSGTTIWLPKDRAMVKTITEVYFSRLNQHRPVFTRSSFEQQLDALYSGEATKDPGFLCSVYLVLALGTLSELNHRVNGAEKEGKNIAPGPTLKKLLPPDWPTHDDLFDRALAVKPELRVTISSLQALILLHWYLYTERQGRTLWRLVGSLVRLAIELGLHHDPTTVVTEDNPDTPTFTEEECQLRIRLWAIILVHDRGTSILLGRPLAIAPSDSNTPRPSRATGNEISEHFVLSGPISEIQADIINSLYAPTRQTADSIMRHATRIIKSMYEFRRQLPESYMWYFSGTDEWSSERKTKLVQDITADEGLTLLKIGITRILLLRALFSSKELPFHSRLSALIDAIVTSHNIIVVHNQLIRFPDIAFFVSPTPLHIAAMVILYGHMSKCDRLPREIALEDVWMALDMLPSFRWRWERKDLRGSHPLIAKLAEEVLKVSLHQVSPTTQPHLISETDWNAEGVLSPKQGQQTTPTMGPAHYPQSPYNKPLSASSGPAVKGSPTKNAMGNLRNDEKLAEIPPGLFYPFYPESQTPGQSAGGVLAANQAIPSYGYQGSSEQYIVEEKDASLANPGVHIWSTNGQQQQQQQQDPRSYQMAT